MKARNVSLCAVALVLGAGLVACKDEKKEEPKPVTSAAPSASVAPAAASVAPSAAPPASAVAAAEDDIETEEDFEDESDSQINEANLESELRKLEDEIK